MSLNNITILESKQASLFSLIQNLYDLSRKVKIDPSATSQFLIRLQTIDKTRDDYIQLLEKLNTLKLEYDPENFTPDFKPLQTFDELYCHIKATEATLKTQDIKPIVEIPKPRHKLPVLELVAFNGDPTNWPLFFQNFKEMIHDNVSLTDAERIQYLISKLSGSALTITAGILPVASNYNIIWNLLIEKYQDPRLLASQYFDKILKFKQITSSSAQNLELFLEHFCASVTALKCSDITDLSDYMLLHIALNKLDRETVTLFEQRFGKEKIPTFESLQQFVKEQRKVACHVQLHNTLPASSASSTKVAFKQQKPIHAFVTNQENWVKTPCLVCKAEDAHPLYRCQQFVSLNPEDRFDIVTKNAFCTNCLGFHSFRNCRSNNVCSKCNKRHHSLIHLNYNTLATKFNLNKNANQNISSQQRSAGSANALHINAPIFPNDIEYDFDVSDTSEMEHTLSHSNYDQTASNNARANEKKDSENFICQPAVTLCADHRATMDVSLNSNENKNTSLFTEISPTARVLVQNKDNISQQMRVLLDTGSNLNFVTTKVCECLGLKIERLSSKVHGIGNSAQDIIGRVTLTFCSQYDSRRTYTVKAAVLDKLTGELPHTKLATNNIPPLLKELPLADPYFDTPGEIDCIIGSGLFPHLLLAKKINIPQTGLVAIESTLGYILMGQFDCQDVNQENEKLFTHVAISNRKLEVLTQKFWELETIQSRKIMSPEDKKCEEIFEQSYFRDSTGRYTVSLPLCEDPAVLGDSYHIAKKRLISLERKLDSDPDLRTGYNDTIREYVDKDYLQKLTDPDKIQSSSPVYYIPHRAVYRPEKKTSKIRIVLDASCATTSGKSLNDILYTGPNLQSNIFDLLINFRLYPIAVSADLEKMYFQLKVSSEHQNLQRILYRFDTQSPIDVYQFDRVSFGLKCSPYLALRVVRQLAKDESETFPNLLDIVSKYSYMDDFLTSIPNEKDVEHLYFQLTELFKRGGFNLTKWISNSQSFLEKVPEVSRATKNLNFDTESDTKIIGMHWNPVDDNFFFDTKSPASDSKEDTKRSVLSATACLFDPLGVLAPSVALMKLIIQECWRRSLDWDEPLPSDLNNLWKKIKNELPVLIQLKIPRCVGLQSGSSVSLVGFSDASERCYGAAVYVRIGSLDEVSPSVSLLCAKSRIASGRQTLARLELCAAHLLAKLMNVVHEVVTRRSPVDNKFAYSDSTITLAWINSSPHRWQTFVANRVAEIQELLPPPHWFHVPGEHNPSDVITRPVTPIKLIDNNTWFCGPDWLQQPHSTWPVNSQENVQQAIPEAKLVSFVQTMEPNPLDILAERVSKWSVLLNITVYVLRFIKKLKSKGTISLLDLNEAENFIIKHLQCKHFSNDIQSIVSNKNKCSSALQKLNPFLVDGILRVGGRLNNASISYNQQHPVVLPSKDKIVKMLVEYFHRLHLHAGPGLLLALIRHNYWILSARNLVKKVVHSCNRCFRLKPKEAQYLMGDLPDLRVHQIKPFAKCGVDYAGPLNITLLRHRGIKSQKAYICLFVCLATKGIHIELVSDLSAEKFLAAFKRFISRRGPCSLIMSDGGRNFVGAKKQLNDLHDLVTSPDYYAAIIEELIPKKIEFRINSPYSPHMGGLWESNIKSMKNILYKVIGTQILTYEELNTVLVEVECLLNSRPLCVLSNDPSDPTALTPAHFLNGTPLKFLPAENVTDIPIGRLQRYALLDKIVQSYWKRWHNEYLGTLQSREKWNVKGTPIKVDTVVVIKEDNLPPLMWPLGVITEVLPGKDGITRVVKVKTKTGIYTRPVVKVCPLPSQ